jgi:CRP-like cAMP-binding protein
MAHDHYFDYLRRVPLFADLDKHELEHVARTVTDLNLGAGREIIHEGAVAHEMVIVVDGTLEVTRGGEHVADIGPGGIAGEMALLVHGTRNSTVRAKTDVSLLHIDGRQFATLLEDVPQLAVKMLPIVAARAAAAIADDH